MKIPFGWLPGSWGLKGDTRKIAEAEYYLNGLELDDTLVDIKYKDDTKALTIAKLKNQKKHKKINDTEYNNQYSVLTLTGDDLKCELLRQQWTNDEMSLRQYNIGIASIRVTPGVEFDLAVLGIDLDSNLITKVEYDKQSATVRGEPYICIIDSNYKPDEKLDGLYFEFDWNDLWITELKEAGYTGFTDDQLVQRWFSDVCKSVSDSEHGDGLDDGQPLPFNSGRIINKVRKNGDPTEYS